MIYYSIYDKAAQKYGPLFGANTDAEAVRSCLDLYKKGEAVAAQHPEDFRLCSVMQHDFDDEKDEEWFVLRHKTIVEFTAFEIADRKKELKDAN